MALRRLFSDKAGASFNQELANETICVRKDCVELIYKVKPSVYVIVPLLHVGDGDAMFFVRSVLRTQRTGRGISTARRTRRCRSRGLKRTDAKPRSIQACWKRNKKEII